MAEGATRHVPSATAVPPHLPFALETFTLHVRGLGVNVVSWPPYCVSAPHSGPAAHVYGAPLEGFGAVSPQLVASTRRSVSSRYGEPAGKQRAVGSLAIATTPARVLASYVLDCATVTVGYVLVWMRDVTHACFMDAIGKNSSRPAMVNIAPHWFCRIGSVSATGDPTRSARNRAVSMPAARSKTRMKPSSSPRTPSFSTSRVRNSTREPRVACAAVVPDTLAPAPSVARALLPLTGVKLSPPCVA